MGSVLLSPSSNSILTMSWPSTFTHPTTLPGNQKSPLGLFFSPGYRYSILSPGTGMAGATAGFFGWLDPRLDRRGMVHLGAQGAPRQ